MKTSFKHISLVSAAVFLTACGNLGTETDDQSRKVFNESWNEVGVTVLERKDFKRQLISNGKLSATAKSSLAFGSQGTVTGIYVSNGDFVSAGDTIAVLDRSAKEIELQNAEIDLERCRIEMFDIIAGFGYSSNDPDIPENILKTAGIRSGYLSAQTSFKRLRYEYDASVLVAPFSGRVADLKTRLYDLAPSGTFCTLIDDSRFNAEFTVLESEYGFLSKGLDVKVYPFGASSAEPFCGKVTNINPSVDKNGQISVTAVLDNHGGLIDGMNVKVIVERSVPGQLVVPKSAVVIRDGMEVMFVCSGGEAVWTYVNVLMSNSDSYAVAADDSRYSELSEGDTVIVSGNLNLADRSKVLIKD